jgi:hypothetical protein
MHTLRQHLVHHRVHMLGCAGGALIAVVGDLVGSSAVAIIGTVICGAFCLDMVRMMVVMRPKRG